MLLYNKSIFAVKILRIFHTSLKTRMVEACKVKELTFTRSVTERTRMVEPPKMLVLFFIFLYSFIIACCKRFQS